MIVKDYEKVEKKLVQAPGVTGIYVRYVLMPEDGADKFNLRVFEVEKGQMAPPHKHPYEHEIFVLKGKGVVIGESGEHEIKYGNVIFIPPDERHTIKNSGDENLVFICLIPAST